MASESLTANAEGWISNGVVAVPVKNILRLEGLAAAALTAVLYAHTEASW